MFTFSKTKIPVCRITGGRNDGKIVYLTEQSNRPISGGNSEPHDPLKCADCDKKFTRKDGLKRHIDSDACRVGYIKKYLTKYGSFSGPTEIFDELDVSDGVIQPLPNPQLDRNGWYACGQAGSGKTFMTGKFAEELQKQNKKKVIVFSPFEKDKSLSNVKNISFVKMSDEMTENPIQVEELANKIVIFDDIESLPKPYNNLMKDLRDKCLQIGRKSGIDVLMTNHMLTDYKNTRILLGETHFILFFPETATRMHIDRLCKEYVGLSKKSIDKLCNLNTRWVCIFKNAPRYIMTEHFLTNLKKFDDNIYRNEPTAKTAN